MKIEKIEATQKAPGTLLSETDIYVPNLSGFLAIWNVTRKILLIPI